MPIDTHRPPSTQRGAALILALLIVSLVAGITTSMAGEYLIDIKYQRNYLDEEQAYFYLLSAEGFAQLALLEDNVNDKEEVEEGLPWPMRDNLCDSWRDVMYIPVDGGQITVHMDDQNSKFNLNTLVRNENRPRSGSGFPYTSEQQVFVRLLQTIGSVNLNLPEAVEIAEAVYDWMDQNNQVEGFGGMEDLEYTAQGYNYRTANASMVSVSELRLIPRISPQLYRELRKHVTVWPSSGRLGRRKNYSVINVNTASPNILRALPKTYGLTPVDWTFIQEVQAAQRTNQVSPLDSDNDTQGIDPQDKPVASADCGFNNMSHFNALMPGGADNPYMDLHSHQIMVSSTITLGNITRKMQTVIHRVKRTGHSVVWARAFGTL